MFIGTFMIEQFVKKIKVPIVCKLENSELSFENGEELAVYTFDNYYLINSIEIDGGKAVITLQERMTSKNNSVGDDWSNDHVERFGHEQNMFDGA